MAAILRVKARWSGFPGAPGYSIFHFRDFGTGEGGGAAVDAAQAQAAVDRVQTFFNAVKTYIPSSVTINVESDVESIEETTGELGDVFVVTPPAAVVGGGGGTYAGPVGAVITWKTNGVRKGRRVRGRSFLVPLAAGSYGNDGLLSPTVRTAVQTAATALAITTSSPDLGVYGRPSSTGATDGNWYVVAQVSVPAKAAVLRSRRD